MQLKWSWNTSWLVPTDFIQHRSGRAGDPNSKSKISSVYCLYYLGKGSSFLQGCRSFTDKIVSYKDGQKGWPYVVWSHVMAASGHRSKFTQPKTNLFDHPCTMLQFIPYDLIERPKSITMHIPTKKFIVPPRQLWNSARIQRGNDEDN